MNMSTLKNVPLSLDIRGRLADGPAEKGDGRAVLAALIDLSQQAVARLTEQPGAAAAMTHLRGTGPGVSFKAAINILEAEHPVELVYPFEENVRVGGAAWPFSLLQDQTENMIMKLRWEPQAHDLPMHTHEHSDRCIFVLEGRGFFHVSDEPVDAFTGSNVRTIAARERDVFVFRRGVVHTFSTFDSPMVLLSCHLPYIPLDDPRQYTLPATQWIAGRCLDHTQSEVVILNGWTQLSALP